MGCALLAGPYNCTLTAVGVVGWLRKYINNVCWDTFITLYTQESKVLSWGTCKPCDNVRRELQGILVDVSDQADAALIEPSQLYTASGNKTDQAGKQQSCKLGKWRWLEGDEEAGRRGDAFCFLTWHREAMEKPSNERLDIQPSVNKDSSINQSYLNICFHFLPVFLGSLCNWCHICIYMESFHIHTSFTIPCRLFQRHLE